MWSVGVCAQLQQLLCPVLMPVLQVPLLRNIRSYVAREYAEQVERSEGPLVCRRMYSQYVQPL